MIHNQDSEPSQVDQIIEEQSFNLQNEEHRQLDEMRSGLPSSVAVDAAMAKDLNLSPGEEVLCIIKRHPVGIFHFYLSTVIGVAILLAFFYYFMIGKPSSGLDSLPDSVVIILVLFIAIILWTVNTIAVRVYKMNKLILTNESLIIERQQGLFNNNRKVLALESVEGISSSQKGLAEQVLNYATLRVSVVGKGDISFPFTGDAQKYAGYIENAREQLMKDQREGRA